MAEDSGSRPDPPGFAPLPPGRFVDLPLRGRNFIREVTGPAGAPPVLLLHGLTANADLNWFAAFPALGERYRVIAPDQRGHGDGPRPDRIALADMADDAAVLIDHLGLGPTRVVGYSMGGAVAQLLWRRHPDAVAGLVLCATAADHRVSSVRGRLVEQPIRHLLGWAGRTLPAAARRRLVELAQRGTLARVQAQVGRDDPLQRWGAQQLLRSDPLLVAAAGAALRRYHSEAWVASIDVSAAVVVNRHDTVVPTGRQQRLAELIGAEVHEVDAGHGAFIEDPDVFVPALLAACRSVEADQGQSGSHPLRTV